MKLQSAGLLMLPAWAFLAFGCSCGAPRVSPHPAPESVASTPEPEPTPEPTPTPWVEVAPAELAPFSADSEQAALAASLRAALAAFEAGEFERTLTNLPGPEAGGPSPELAAWLRARSLEELGRVDEADAALAAVTQGRRAGEALLRRAALHLDEPERVLALLGEEPVVEVGHPLAEPGVAARADVQRGAAFRARGAEGDQERAWNAYLRVWRGAPSTGASAEAQTALDALGGRLGREPTLADKVARAASLSLRHGNKKIIALLEGERRALVSLAATDPEAACVGHLELGRAFHKRRTYDQSVPLLTWAARHCDPAGEAAVRAIYLQAQGMSRSGRVTESVAAFTSLADLRPEHSYADDGLHHAARLEAGENRHSTADALFDRQLREFPDGDMAADTLWGRAWSALLDGRPADALPFLDQLAALPSSGRRDSVLQARYWKSRALLRSDPSRREEAIVGLEALAQDGLLHYYGALAFWSLRELAPDRADTLGLRVAEQVRGLRSAPAVPAVFRPERDFFERPAARTALQLLKAGLHDEAAAEVREALGMKAHERWNQDTLLYASALLHGAEDAQLGHDILRRSFRKEFPQYSAETRPLLTHGYPEAFGPLIREVTAQRDWDPLVFQGLVREESAFSPAVVSWAGAIGLSQLMWPTAKSTARRMGVRGLQRSDLREPKQNLEIGTTYFDGLVGRWRGHLPLAIASYNAGPGAVQRWVEARGDRHLDEWVEAIPYDQTRHYVKRVVTSYQIYSVLYAGDRAFVPLRPGPVGDSIRGADPTAAGSGDR